jgi:hypothetical protein
VGIRKPDDHGIQMALNCMVPAFEFQTVQLSEVSTGLHRQPPFCLISGDHLITRSWSVRKSNVSDCFGCPVFGSALFYACKFHILGMHPGIICPHLYQAQNDQWFQCYLNPSILLCHSNVIVCFILYCLGYAVHIQWPFKNQTFKYQNHLKTGHFCVPLLNGYSPS